MAVQRWTDEMLDELASTVGEMRDSMTEMRGSMTEMRDSITEMRDGMTEMRDSITEMRDSITEMRDSITEMRDGMSLLHDSVDGLRVTSQALLQVAAQHQRDMELVKEDVALLKQRQAESDQRFNVLLEELRYLIRGNSDN